MRAKTEWTCAIGARLLLPAATLLVVFRPDCTGEPVNLPSVHSLEPQEYSTSEEARCGWRRETWGCGSGSVVSLIAKTASAVGWAGDVLTCWAVLDGAPPRRSLHGRTRRESRIRRRHTQVSLRLLVWLELLSRHLVGRLRLSCLRRRGVTPVQDGIGRASSLEMYLELPQLALASLASVNSWNPFRAPGASSEREGTPASRPALRSSNTPHPSQPCRLVEMLRAPDSREPARRTVRIKGMSPSQHCMLLLRVHACTNAQCAFACPAARYVSARRQHTAEGLD